jgi:hypothetical protein
VDKVQLGPRRTVSRISIVRPRPQADFDMVKMLPAQMVANAEARNILGLRTNKQPGNMANDSMVGGLFMLFRCSREEEFAGTLRCVWCYRSGRNANRDLDSPMSWPSHDMQIQGYVVAPQIPRTSAIDGSLARGDCRVNIGVDNYRRHCLFWHPGDRRVQQFSKRQRERH